MDQIEVLMHASLPPSPAPSHLDEKSAESSSRPRSSSEGPSVRGRRLFATSPSSDLATSTPTKILDVARDCWSSHSSWFHQIHSVKPLWSNKPNSSGIKTVFKIYVSTSKIAKSICDIVLQFWYENILFFMFIWKPSSLQMQYHYFIIISLIQNMLKNKIDKRYGVFLVWIIKWLTNIDE
jgi:hypothetical protein